MRFFPRLFLFSIVISLFTLIFTLTFGILLTVFRSPINSLLNAGENTWTFLSVASLGVMITFLASMWISSRWIEHRPFQTYGFKINRGWWVDFSFGLALGAGLMTLIFLTELAAGWISITGYLTSQAPSLPFGSGFIAGLLLFINVGVYEEVFFRGFFLRNLAEAFHPPWIKPKNAVMIAWLATSILFGIVHIENPFASWISSANIAAAGLLLGLGFILTGDLAIPIGLHITWNFFQGMVFGFPVSGNQPVASVFAITQGGEKWLTGAEFGPEAGVLGLLAMGLGSVLTLVWLKYRRGSISINHKLAEYPKIQN